MAGSDLELRIEGPDAQRLADELAELIKTELGHEPRRKSPPDQPEPGGAVFRGDPVAVAALILAIPGAIVAVVDLAERMKLKPRIDRLLARVKERLQGDSKNQITLRSRGGRAHRLDRIDTPELIALAMELADRTSQDGGPGDDAS